MRSSSLGNYVFHMAVRVSNDTMKIDILNLKKGPVYIDKKPLLTN